MIADQSTRRKFGALRDVHDVRDRMYRASPRAEPVPQHVDLRKWGGPIKDQGEEGSCTGHAFSSAREWIARKYEKTSPILSPQCLYADELIASGDFPKDDGAMPRTGCQVLTSLGCCEAALYPYVAGKITVPTPAQAANALKYKTGAYHRIGSLSDFLRCLADPTPWPVLVGFVVYESFMLQQVADTGIMPIPKPGEQQAGGHEVLCLGYDLPKQWALMQNSWGDDWGQRSYFWMPLGVVKASASDLWMVHTGGPWK
ncbi:MAG: C1 family peptidase [Acidobacteriia bacterium]|nr:C1 family peptidase [Terriglobia bacterium]